MSKHITGLKGYIRVRANYYTLNNDGAETEHSIQESYSKKTIITNNTYKRLFNNAVLNGKWKHFQQFHRQKHSDTLWTYKIISSEIIYVTSPTIYYDKNSGVVKAERVNKPTVYYSEERGIFRKAKEYIHKKNVTEGRNRKDNIESYDSREYKRMIAEQRIRTRKENLNKRRYRVRTKRVALVPSVQRYRSIKKSR